MGNRDFWIAGCAAKQGRSSGNGGMKRKKRGRRKERNEGEEVGGRARVCLGIGAPGGGEVGGYVEILKGVDGR